MALKKVSFGVIVSTRSFFPDALAVEGRKKILDKLESLGYGAVIMPEDATPFGAVETLDDALKYADYFSMHRKEIDGILVILPNFGDEVGVSTAIDKAGLNVPVMVQAVDDKLEQMTMDRRRDAFCGKLSVCNNLYQRGIKFTNTTLHACDLDSDIFTEDIHFFAAVCRVVGGLKNARIGAIGQRPDPFHTVRYSEKLLQASGITVSVVDLSEIIFAALKMPTDEDVQRRIAEIKDYGPIDPTVPEENIVKSAKLWKAVEEWIVANKVDATAIQCWSSIEENYGTATCLPMSMMGEAGKPSACEMDVTGALTMYALYLASGEPSGYLDWNNNFNSLPNKAICTHCSNFPKSFIGDADFEISNLDILGESLGRERCFGGLKANIAKGDMTYAKISTDDSRGVVKMYVGEGTITDDKVDTVGGRGVVEVPDMQKLLDYMCMNGFEHHVAMNRSKSAKILKEACEKYLGWEVYVHS